ncbi:hypothetical protein J3459_010003 [Metarhizium acridum]|nr:hypothetical protein J3459_010003 [Metarhizium acridum]
MPYSSEAQVDEAFNTVSNTFKSNATKPLEWRIKQLRKTWWMLEDNRERIRDGPQPRSQQAPSRDPPRRRRRHPKCLPRSPRTHQRMDQGREAPTYRPLQPVWRMRASARNPRA